MSPESAVVAQRLLTDKFINDMENPASRVQISDIKSTNLNLIIQTSGVKTWVWRGRVNGQPEKLRLGHFPLHGVKDARNWADALTRDRDLGIDIAGRIVEETEAEQAATREAEIAAARTVQKVWDAYWTKEGRLGRAAALKKSSFDREILPAVGSKVFADVTKSDLLALTEEKGHAHPSGANKLHAYIGRLWNWATMDATGIKVSGTEINVYHGVKPPFKPKSRKRYLSDDEIVAVWNAVENETIALRSFYRLLILTGARRNEIAWLKRSNINLRNREITITTENAKNGVELRIPLSPLALETVNEALSKHGNSAWLFPSGDSEDSDTPISGFTKLHDRVLTASKTSGWTKHDLRRTFSTNMSRLKVQKIVTECLINHVSGSRGGVAGIYDQFEYLAEMREATELYSAFIVELVSSQSKP